MEQNKNPIPAGFKSNFAITWETVAKNFRHVAISNTANLVNAIFFSVSALLLVLGETREGLFLGSVMVLNAIIGIAQDLRAKAALEKLQALSAPRIIRVLADGKKELINLEQIIPGDTLLVEIGDQIPADGAVCESFGIEVNEALITGESNYIKKNTGDQVLAGSIVMSGAALLRAEAAPRDCYVARMTEKIKKYNPQLSPIQKNLNAFIKYMSYLLLVIIIYVVAHGIMANDLFVSIVRDIGALTGTLVPQGLVLSITIFFAYGAVRLLKDDVLMQEINATEKLARIRHLCIDKTGTLTERKPILEETIVYDNLDGFDLGQVLAGYIAAHRDSSEIVAALRARAALSFPGNILAVQPFSSERKYGAAFLEINQKKLAVVLGAPDILAKYFKDENEKDLLQKQIGAYADQAKRLVLLAQADIMPENELAELSLRPLAMFVLVDPLRPGTEKIIDFFQKRGVRLRVISGDNPRTVQAVARLAGIKYADMVATGSDMEKWDEVEYEERVPAFHLFARVKPGQKEKIISLLKKSGYTAMVGDGANDALAIKKADLGVAMFDGAPATRQIAPVVLMNNSFSALPKGVAMAEAIILNIELVASVFLNKVAAGLALFLILAALGYSYPLSPSNMTVINYFTIWLPMAYWTFFPVSDAGLDPRARFMAKILLFSIINGIIMALAAAAVFMLDPAAKFADSNFLVMLALIVLGYWYFALAPLNYGAWPSEKRRRALLILGAICFCLVMAAAYLPGGTEFFGLRRPEIIPLLLALATIAVAGYLQYIITIRWFCKQN